jgi:sugar phosphate permease
MSLPSNPSLAESAYRKVSWRLLPVFFTAYILAYIDRVNVGFAKLAMREEPWFSDAVFATGSGIFFIGYLLFEIPGNLMMHRLGARVWITRIMVSWGIVSSLCGLVSSAPTFYTMRFLLGVAEAGFFPGIILYLTAWYPQRYRARMVAAFMTAVAFAGIIGSPLSGWILEKAAAWKGAEAWQWLFILEGIPSILFGLALPLLLCDGPEKARWLNEEERSALRQDMAADQAHLASRGKVRHSVSDALTAPGVWLCAVIYFCFTIGLYGVSFWLPQIIESTVTTDKSAIGLYAAIPWLCAVPAMVLFGRHSDRKGERRWHIFGAALAGATAFVLAGSSLSGPASMIALLSVGTMSVMSVVSTFWSIPPLMLSGRAAAAGIALINSLGNLGGYLSPELFAWLKGLHGLGGGLTAVGCFLALGGVLTFTGTRRIHGAGSPNEGFEAGSSR